MCGPLDVFAIANHLVETGYRTHVAAITGEALRTSSGVRVVPDCTLASAPRSPDTIIIAGGPGSRAAATDPELLRWLRGAASRARRVGSVCTGTLVLASAGLLEGRRATTHWASCAALAARYPGTEVDLEATYVRDGALFTSAGVTAALDLALALVEEDHGPAVALEIARVLVLPQRRGGAQPQLAAALRAQRAERRPVRELQDWMPEHLTADLSVPALARRVAMSPRNFARAWLRETQTTPAAYVRALRAERARSLLETSGLSIDAIARECGFASVEALRRAIRAELGVAPSVLRRRLGAATTTR